LLIEEQKDGRTDLTPPNLNPRSPMTQRANYEEFGKPAIRIGRSSVSFFRTMRLLFGKLSFGRSGKRSQFFACSWRSYHPRSQTKCSC
jgi:hypothetical protein